MLRLRLEVVSSDNLSELCNQATRIATANGIEVVFELNGKEVVAKPGMNGESLAHECTCESPKPEKPAKDKEPKPEKEKGGKAGKSKPSTDENTTTATPAASETEVPKESV